ncbi:MAG: DUF2058 family protein [Thiotrichales bacterium]
MTMKNALQEQLLKAGLITQEQLEQAAAKPRPKDSSRPAQQRSQAKSPPNPRKQAKPAPRPAAPRPVVAPPRPADDLKAAYAAKAKAEQEEAQRKAELAALRKANKPKLATLIQAHTLNAADADVPFQFQVGTNIKRIYVTEVQRTQLLAGDLVITFLEGKRCIIPSAICAQILELDPKKILITQKSDIEAARGDDPYAEYEVPDDLVW